MRDSAPETTIAQNQSVWAYLLCSLAPLLTYVSVLPVWQHYHRQQGWRTTDAMGVALGIIVALNCIWWFLRCPRRQWLVKVLVFLVMLAGVLRALANVYANVAYRLYGG